ncbi:MAG: ELM1/GtrOC1 family putative glycosyltransferase [Roseibacillus sp.]
MHLLILTDGKKGHENQSLGLAEAILRRREGDCELVSIEDPSTIPQPQKKADLVIGAGHYTHPFLLKFARSHRCPSVVIMKPTLPKFLFSYCLIPEHDLKAGRKIGSRIIATKGALNRLPESQPPKEEKGLIMLGGPCKHFDWQEAPLLKAIETIITKNPNLAWTIGDSRRTPPTLLAQIAQLNLELQIAPHTEATGSWLSDELLTSKVAWITPDSTSMLFEALTAGCHLGTLPLPPNNTRLSRAHDQLAKDNWLTPFSQYDAITELPPAPAPLHETARCAEVLLAKIA